MPSMPERTDTSVAISPDRHPNSWGLGDGQAIPWEYAPAPEARDIVTLKERYGLFIDGRSVPATGGETFTSIDPATEQPLAEVARAADVDVDKAVRAARRAQRRSWGQLSGRERAKYLFRISRILQERSREFAVLESMDSGKPIKESRATSTCRSPRTTSGTTPAGRTSSTTPSRAASRSRSASRPRSSRGTSRC